MPSRTSAHAELAALPESVVREMVRLVRWTSGLIFGWWVAVGLPLLIPVYSVLAGLKLLEALRLSRRYPVLRHPETELLPGLRRAEVRAHARGDARLQLALRFVEARHFLWFLPLLPLLVFLLLQLLLVVLAPSPTGRRAG